MHLTLARDLLLDESGAAMVEYAVMAAFIAAVCFAIVVTIGQKTNSEFSHLNANF